MITNRDQEVIDFLGEFKVASTSTIANIFYPTLRKAQKRLKYMFDNGVLKRERAIACEEYVYFIKSKPSQIRHRLLITKVYENMRKIEGVEVLDFIPTYSISGVISDGLVVYKYKERVRVDFIEVQIERHNPINKCIDKYVGVYNDGKWRDTFGSRFPRVLVFTNAKKEVEHREFKVVKVRLDMEDIKKVVGK